MTQITKKTNHYLKALAALAAPVVVTAGLLAASAMPAHASTTFTVNDAGDAPDTDTSDGKCFAYKDFFGFDRCTLRAAIEQANATPGDDAIGFAIPTSSGVKTIKPNSPLPMITDPVTIDGYTQGDATASPDDDATENTLKKGTNARLLVELDGSGAGELASGLEINDNSVVRGLVINRFGSDGIRLFAGASGTMIEGNFLGTDPSGQGDLGNGSDGMSVVNANDFTVGGASPEARNLISGNQGDGIEIDQSGGTIGKQVMGNLIGTQKDGISPLGNSEVGVGVFRSDTVAVGGETSASANTIAFNGDDGVQVTDGASDGNSVLRNSIFANTDLGIDLGFDGPTANDPGDADDGENGLQNKPALISAKTSGGSTTIQGTLDSKPNETYTVRFFSNPGGNEGKTFIGKRTVTTSVDGLRSFVFSPKKAVGAGKTVTATATDSGGNTSEFSAPRTVVAQ